jgi:hypothetical protein
MAKSNNTMSTIAATLAGTSSGSMQQIPEKQYLDAAGIKLARDAYVADKNATHKWAKFSDYARSQGVTYSMVIAGGCARDWIQQNIVIPFGLSPEKRDLVLAPKSALKGWDDDKKKARRYAIMDIGSLTNKIAGHLMTEEEKKAAEAAKQSKAKGGNDSDSDSEEKPEKKTAPLADTLKKQLADMIVRIQKADEDNLEGFAPDKLCKALNAAIALIR